LKLPTEREIKKLSPARQKELRDLLRQIKEQAERNPLEAYRPYPKQDTFHSAEEKTKMFIGGNRAGKTTCGAADDLIQALPRELVPEHLLPYKRYGNDEPFKGRVITPDLAHTMEVVIHKYREMVPREAILGGEWRKAFDKTRRILKFENGSVIDFMSTEQDPDKFGGVDLHRVHYDEEPSGPNAETIWQESKIRLWDHDGDTILTMTPLFGYALVYDRVWSKRNEAGIFVIQASVFDNPHIPRHLVEEEMRDWGEEEKKARLHGEFVHFGGLFYDEFTQRTHTQPAPSPDTIKNWDVVVGIDPGTQTGCVWVGFDGDNRAFVFDEYYPKDALVPDIAEEIKRRNAIWGVTPSYVIDPAARIRSGPNQEQFTTEYARNGIYCGEGQNARGPGILEIKRRLQKGYLFIADDLHNLIWEFGRYRKDPNSQDDFAAIKKDDHLLDALRYAVMAKTWVIPKVRPRERTSNHPFKEPPFRGFPPSNNPPLGAMS
jgi:phage terminase large subunit-like protein